MPKLQQFAIIAPQTGIKEDFPAIFLPAGVLQGAENATFRYGMMERAKGRLKELVNYLVASICPALEAANWTGTNGWSAGSGKLTKVTNANIGTITPSGTGATPVAGLTYKIVITASATSGAITYTYGGTAGGTAITATTITDYVTATNTDKLIISGAIESTAEITAVSIQETTLGATATKVPTPDGNPALFYHSHTKAATGTRYLCAFTKAYIYFWVAGAKYWQLKFTCSSNCEEWSVISYNDKFVATNNIDKVLVWDCGAGDFVALDDTTNGIEFATGVYCTKAKVVAEYERYLVIGYTTEAGTTYPSRIRWCAIGDEENWKTGDADFADLEGSDPICGFGKKESRFYIFKEAHIHVVWLVSSALIFNKVVFSTKSGCKSANSILNTPDGKLYYFSSDYTFREINDGEISQNIDPTVKAINPVYLSKISAVYSSRFNQIAWSVPYGATATENNLVLVFNKGQWEKRGVAVSAFGEYKRPTGFTYTWNTLPYSSWDTWAWDMWDTPESGTDFPVVLAGDISGNTFDFYGGETDDAADYTGHFILSTDLSKFQKAAEYKRLLLMQLYFKSGAGTVAVDVKRDTEAGWQTAGSVVLTSTGEFVIKDLPCDYRAKNYYIKMSGALPFKFAGVIFKFLYTGER